MKSQRKKNSPWNLSPACTTRNALQRWDWKNSSKHLAGINAARAAKGLPPLKLRIPDEVVSVAEA